MNAIWRKPGPPLAKRSFVSPRNASPCRWTSSWSRTVRGLAGLVKVVVKKNFVGVVAEKPWQAIQAAKTLKARWTSGVGLPSHRDFYDYLRNQKPSRDTLLVNSKDVDEKLAQARTV